MKNDAGCLFCKIATKQSKAYPIYTDKQHIAFLTPFPITKGETIVIPKEHIGDNILDLNSMHYTNLMNTVHKVGQLLTKKLQVSRCAIVFEGTGIAHVHAKLYPLHGPLAHNTNIWPSFKVFLKNIPVG